jgi:hypothetical protein
VKAWDDDWPDGDDFMGQDLTDQNGNYAINYEGKHWDPSPHSIPIWRPDIFISVHIKNATGQWVKLGRSATYNNHRLRRDKRINLKIEVYPTQKHNTPFKPNQHGFKFNNNFVVNTNILGFDVGPWNMGFCGGMCAGALSRFTNNQPVPPNVNPPAQGTPLFDELLKRQVDTLLHPENIVPSIYNWQSSPDEGHWYRKHSVGHRTKKAWWVLKYRLDRDQPTILVLIQVEGYFANITDNHQVLAFGYEYNPSTKDVKVNVYDPNHPGTTQTLTMNIGLPKSRLNAKNSTGKRLRGFMVNPNTEYASRQIGPGIAVIHPSVIHDVIPYHMVPFRTDR